MFLNALIKYEFFLLMIVNDLVIRISIHGPSRKFHFAGNFYFKTILFCETQPTFQHEHLKHENNLKMSKMKICCKYVRSLKNYN